MRFMTYHLKFRFKIFLKVIHRQSLLRYSAAVHTTRTWRTI